MGGGRGGEQMGDGAGMGAGRIGWAKEWGQGPTTRGARMRGCAFGHVQSVGGFPTGHTSRCTANLSRSTNDSPHAGHEYASASS